MKQHYKSSTKLTIWVIILSILMITLGCSDSNDAENKSIAINSVTEKSTPPKVDIHSAVISNDIEAVKQHLAAGTDLNQKDPFGGSSPLISAALFDKKEIAEILINAGADINFVNNDGSNALHTAAFFCRPEIVQILLDNGIDKTVRNKMGSTAYESVAGDFKDVKPFYDMLGQSLAPLGLVLNDEHLKKTRPIIAQMLK